MATATEAAVREVATAIVESAFDGGETTTSKKIDEISGLLMAAIELAIDEAVDAAKDEVCELRSGIEDDLDRIRDDVKNLEDSVDSIEDEVKDLGDAVQEIADNS